MPQTVTFNKKLFQQVSLNPLSNS